MESFSDQRLQEIILSEKGTPMYDAERWRIYSWNSRCRDPERLKREGRVVTYIGDLNCLFYRACREGYVKVVQYFVDCGMFNPEENSWPLRWAVLKGQFQVFKLLMEESEKKGVGIERFPAMLYEAARGGNPDLVEYILHQPKGAEEIEWGVVVATQHGYLDVVKVMMPYVPGDPLAKLFRCACTNGRLHLAKYFVKQPRYSVLNLRLGFIQAAQNGHLPILKWLEGSIEALTDTEILEIGGESVNAGLYLTRGAGSFSLWTTEKFLCRLHLLLSFFRGSLRIQRGMTPRKRVPKKPKRYLISKWKLFMECGSDPYYDGNIGMIVCSYLD